MTPGWGSRERGCCTPSTRQNGTFFVSKVIRTQNSERRFRHKFDPKVDMSWHPPRGWFLEPSKMGSPGGGPETPKIGVPWGGSRNPQKWGPLGGVRESDILAPPPLDKSRTSGGVPPGGGFLGPPLRRGPLGVSRHVNFDAKFMSESSFRVLGSNHFRHKKGAILSCGGGATPPLTTPPTRRHNANPSIMSLFCFVVSQGIL